MKSGQIILLNGTSSAGKTTIAAALHSILDEPHYLTGIDHFLHRLPPTVIVISDDVAPPPAKTWLAVMHEGSVRRVEIGPGGLHLLEGMYRSIAAFSNAGINVIVDDVIYDPRVFRIALNVLPSRQVFFVGIRCPLEVAEQRELARGDRAPGGARFFGERVHAGREYDLEVDSSIHSADVCAQQIKLGLIDRRTPTALERQSLEMEAP